MPVALGIVGLWALGRFVDLDKVPFPEYEGSGAHYRVDLVNDTAEPLRFLLCDDDVCESFAITKRVDAGDSYHIVGEVGDPAWWLVKDKAGGELGCFRIDFDRSQSGIDLLASHVQPCP